VAVVFINSLACLLSPKFGFYAKLLALLTICWLISVWDKSLALVSI
jgi:hypothetical protein